MVSTTLYMGRPRKQHKTKHVRMREEMAEQIKLIAMRRGLDISDLMDSLFSPIVTNEYAKTIDELAKQSKRLIEDRKSK